MANEDTCAPTEPTPEAEANTEQLSPQRIEELDDIIVFVHDNLSSDQPKTNSTETIEQEQPIPHVEIVLT